MLTLNKKALKKIVILLICFTIFFASNVKAVVKPTSQFYVNDYAELLNEETKNYIMNANISLNSKTGAQIVVVTVTSLEGQSLEEYATKVFREFGIGDKDKNNGLLLLLALEEREFRVEVGYGLEGILPDAKTGRIQDEYIIPYLKDDNWNDGIKNGFNAFLSIIADEYNVEINQEEAIKVEDNTVSGNVNFSVFYVSLMFGYIISVINKHKSNKIGVPILIIIYALVQGIITYFITKSISVIFINLIIGVLGNVGGYFLASNGIFFIRRRQRRILRWLWRRIFWWSDSQDGGGSSGGGGSSRRF